MERNFKILNCVSKRLDSEQEAKDYIDDAICNLLSKHVRRRKLFQRNGGASACACCGPKARAPISLKKLCFPYMFWQKITIRVINVIFRFLSCIQTFWNAIQNLEVSLDELFSFIQSMFDIASNKHRNQYVSLFNYHFISKMPWKMTLNFQKIYENYEFIAS